MRKVDARNVDQEPMNTREPIALNALQEARVLKEQRINLNVFLAKLVLFPLGAQVHAQNAKQALLKSTELLVRSAL